MKVLQKTWLATVLFVLASSLMWGSFVSWGAAWRHLLPTLLLAPFVWWFVVGRRSSPGVRRGMLGGALTGFVSQAAENIPDFWYFVTHLGRGDGEEQAIAYVSVAFFLMIGFCATFLGALIGLMAVVVQRRLDKRHPPR